MELEAFPPVDICLATYNGGAWICDFLDSLLAQTYPSWRLVVSDDGSTDGTLQRIQDSFMERPERLLIVDRMVCGAGIVRNFSDAIEASNAEYVFLADQDDVWLPNKLMDMYLDLRRLEGVEKFPSVVYSNSEVVDQDLKLLSNSWWRYSEVPSDWALSLKQLLVQNSVPGCSMAINRKLLSLALPIPEEAIMHDWWLMLVGAAAGRVSYCDKKTILYRRHKSAATYSEKSGLGEAFRRFFFEKDALRLSYKKSVDQARKLSIQISQVSSIQANQLVRAYVRTSGCGWFKRRWILARYKFLKPTLRGTVRFYFWI